MNWKKTILWAVAAVVVLVAGTVVTGVLLIQHNGSFRQFVLKKVAQSVYESTGARLEARDFSLHLSNLSLDVYNAVLRGTEGKDQPPLLTAEHLNIGITVDSVLQRTWHFRDVVVDHPQAHVEVSKTGENNLPKSQQQSSGNSNVFDLGIRRLMVNRGEVYYNDRKTPLTADLHDLEFTAGYDPTQKRYQGHMSYDDGHLQYGDYAPLPHNLDAGFSLTPDRLNLDRLALSIGQSRAVLNATVQDYSSDPKVQANYDASVVTAEFGKILKNPSIPSGTVRVTGLVKYQQQPNRPFLQTAAVWGMVSSPELYVKTPSVQTAVHNLSAKYRLENGNADVENMHAELLDGRLDGKLTVRDLTGAGKGKLEATLKDVSLDLLQKVTKTNTLREAHLVGNVSANAEASWAKSLKNMVAHSDMTIAASLGQNPSTPLNGVIHADYSAAGQQLALHQSYIRTPQTSITLDGKVSELSQLQVRMHSNDLHEVESVAAHFKTASAQGPASQPLDLHGTATVNATITGSLTNPKIKGQLQADNLRVKGSAWKLVRADIDANPALVSITNGELQPATQGYLKFQAQAALKKWSYSPSSPIAANVVASHISIADLERMANKTFPVTGTLAMNVSVRGSQLEPQGQGDITLSNAQVSGEKIQNANLHFTGNGKQLNTNMTIHMPAGVTEAKASYDPKTQGYQVQLQAHNIRLEKLAAVKAKNMQLSGGVNIDANGRGTVKSPELVATIDIPQLQVQKQSIQGIKLQTHVQNEVADIALDSNVAQTYVKARGSVGIKAPYMANVHLDTGRIAFAPLLALYAPAQANDVSGETELHAFVQGPLEHKEKVEAHLQIPVLTGKYKQMQLGAAQPIRLDYRNGVAVLQPTSLEGTDTNLRMQANVPVNNLKAAVYLLQGTIDLKIAQLIDPTLQSTGQIQLDIDSRRFAGNVEGQVKIVNATVHTEEAPVGLDHANGTITLTRNRVEITSFEGRIGSGSVTMRGGVTYRPTLQFDLAMAANQIRVRYPEGLRTILNSNLALTGSKQAALVSGQVQVQQISFTPDFDLSTFISQFSNSTGTGGPSGGFMQNVKLSVAVQSTSQMQLASSQVSVSGDANLRLVGTADTPVILGRADLTGGEVFLAGNRYTLQSGTIDFLNPVRTEPVVNLRVQSTIDQYNITMNIQGPIERLRTDYTSDPALPPVDIINLIAFGKTTEASGANPAPTGSLGAESIAAQGISSQVSGRIAKVAGLSHLSIDPALGGNGEDPGARITVQQRVTGNFFVTFATDVTSTQRQALQMEYRFNRKWSASAIRDQNGGFGVDARYTKDY